MVSVEQSREVLLGIKQSGIDFIVSVPDTNLAELITLLEADAEVAHVPVGREEEGIGVCVGAYLGGKRPAMLMQNAGLLNSCNALTTTGMQFGIPLVLLVYYAGDMGDSAFHTLGIVTEPVLQGLGIKYAVARDPADVRRQIAETVTSAYASKRPVALLLARSVL